MAETATRSADATKRQQRRAKAYARARRELQVAGWLLGGAYIALWLLAGAGPAVRDALAAWTASPWLIVAGFGCAFALPLEILTYPLTFYGGFVLPHAYGQSRQTFAQWMADVAKGWAVGGVLGLLLLEGLYALLRWQPNAWWLWAAAGMLAVNVLLTHLGPVLIFPLFFTFTPLDDEELRGRLLRLCERARTSVRGVFTFDLGRKTRGANAALAGLGGTRRILLSDTLCKQYTPAEVEVVLAHELGHHLRGHLWKGIAASVIGTVVMFAIADAVLHAGAPVIGAAGVHDVAALPLLALTLGVLALLGMPLGNMLSRRFEREADSAALALAAEPAAMITTMEKLADHNLSDREPHPFVTWWFHSHPPVNQRIATAEAFVRAHGPAAAPSA